MIAMRSRFWAAVVFPVMLCAQGPKAGLRQGPALWEGAWWNSPIVQNLDLSETQRKDIRGTGNVNRPACLRRLPLRSPDDNSVRT